MMPRSYFFWLSLSFLFGIGFQSSGYGKYGIYILCTTILVVFLFQKKISQILKEGWRNIFVCATCLCVFGIVYVAYDTVYTRKEAQTFEHEKYICGEIISYPSTYEYTRKLLLKPEHAKRVRVQVFAEKYPEYTFGDSICIQGDIKIDQEKKGRDILFASFPKIEKRARTVGGIKNKLFQVRENIIHTYEYVLPKQESALLSGIVLGEKNNFEKKFQEALQKSGTTHIVALSGYNISVVLYGIMSVAAYIVSRKKGLWLALIGVFLFTLTTGGEASIVRAAIMGSIAIIAKYKGKQMDVNNAVLCAGACMVLFDPSVLLFDVGFQLSFFALLGLVYIAPIFQMFMGKEKGMGGIKENFIQTVSAQVAVLPILFYTFGYVSAVSIFANILILFIIPIIMFLGFCIACSSFISLFFAKIFGYIVYALLAYQVFIIEIFGNIGWNIEYRMGVWLVFIYYISMGIFLYFIRKKYVQKIARAY